MDTIIIGSGISGLASAIRCAVKGHHVVVLEANDTYGGKLAEWASNGYRFDMGPSLFTQPHLVEELFELAGKSAKDYFDYNELDTCCNYFWDDGTLLPACSCKFELDENCQNILETKEGIVKNYLEKSANTYDLTEKTFLKSSLHKRNTYRDPAFKKALKRLFKLRLTGSLNSYNRRKLKNDKLVQLFNRYATYNGSDPFQAPAMLSIIPHLEFNHGSYFPVKGMRSIADALYQLAMELGVQFRFNTPVTSIEHEDGKITEVKSKDAAFTADQFISAIDVHHIYRLMGEENCKAYQRTLHNRSSSGLVFYWGIGATNDYLDVHNIFFSSDYKKEFRQIFKEHKVPDDPTIYVHVSSKANKQDAPEGKENWFVMVNTPPNNGQDWQQIAKEVKEKVIRKLDHALFTHIEPLIETEHCLTPDQIELNTGAFTGSLYGNNSNSASSAFLRHPNHSKRYSNLYFTGGTVHPGGGIPFCLQSSEIVDRIIPANKAE